MRDPPSVSRGELSHSELNSSSRRKMASDMLLYWGSGSGPCWRVMITLEEKGLQGYQSKMISFSEKGHKREEVTKLNPRGQVPTFKHGNIIVNESFAICDYLEATFADQGYKLHPSDPAQLAAVLQRKFEYMNIQKTVYDEFLYYQFRTKPEDIDQEALKVKKEAMLSELTRWEGHLDQLGDGSYIAGKDFSMADVIFFPGIAFLVRVGMKLAPRYPRLQAYYDLIKDRPSVQASWPPHWKDSPNGTMLAEV